MTYMYELHGPQYHWIPELYRRLKLPVYDGIQQALELFNQQRKVALDKLKTDEAKRKRLQLKVKRTKGNHKFVGMDRTLSHRILK